MIYFRSVRDVVRETCELILFLIVPSTAVPERTRARMGDHG